MYPIEEFLIGLAVGAAGAFGLRELVRAILARREARANEVSVPEWVRPPSPADGFGAPGREPLAGHRPPSQGVGPPTGPAAPGDSGANGHRPAFAATPTRDPVFLSRRIVEHLFQLGRFDPDEVGLPAATQRGIGEALGAEQSTVSKVLRRLVAAGTVEVSRRHVRGGDRRVNVYTLTRSGELLAHELRSRSADARPPLQSPVSNARSPVGVDPARPVDLRRSKGR